MRTVRLLVPLLLLRAGVAAQTPADPRLDRLKTAAWPGSPRRGWRAGGAASP